MAGQRCKDAGYVGCLVLHRAPGNPKQTRFARLGPDGQQRAERVTARPCATALAMNRSAEHGDKAMSGR